MPLLVSDKSIFFHYILAVLNALPKRLAMERSEIASPS
jgi:hypothetical protein